MRNRKLKPCNKCKQPHDTPFKMCGECRRKHREYQAALLAERKANGRCGQCGREPELGGAYCSACLAYFRNYFRIPGNREKNLDAQKRTRTDWKAQGRCTRCGQHPPAENRVTCEECLEYAKEYRNAKSE